MVEDASMRDSFDGAHDGAHDGGGNADGGDVVGGANDNELDEGKGGDGSLYMPASLKHIRDSSTNVDVFQLLFDMISFAHASDSFMELTSVCDKVKSLLELYDTVHAKSTTIVPMMQRKASTYVTSIKKNLHCMTTKVVHDKPQFEDMSTHLDDAVMKIMQNILAEVSLKMM
jgi:hypothetical protein